MSVRLVFVGLAGVVALAALLAAQTSLMFVAVALVGIGFAGLDATPASADLLKRWWRRWLGVDPLGFATLLILASLCMTGAAVSLSRTTRFSVLPWLLAIGLLLAAAAHLDGIGWDHVKRLRALSRRPNVRVELSTVGAITLMALILRAYALDAYPPAFHGDEGELALIAREILKGQRFSLFGTSSFSSIPFFFTYLQAASMFVFGQTIVGVRVLSAVAGAACIPAVYALVRTGWGPLAASVAAWLTAVSHLHLHYSRLALSNIEVTLTMTVMMLLLAVSYEQSRRLNPAITVGEQGPDRILGRPGVWSLLVLTGMVIGISQYLYYAARVMPLVAAPLLFVLWRRRSASLAQIVGLVLGLLVVFAPLLAHHINNPDTFFARVQTVSIFRDTYAEQLLGRGASLPTALPGILYEQMRRVLSLFLLAGDAGGFYFYNVPGFDTLTSILFWLGMGAALARWRRFHEQAMLLWFWLGALFGGVLTIDAPSGQRLLIMVPSVFALGGVLVARVTDMLSATKLGRLGWLIGPIGTSGALLLLAMNVAIYFFEYAPRALSREATVIGKELSQDASQYHAFMLTGPVLYENHGTIRFLARDVPIVHLNNRNEFRKPTDNKGIVLVALEHRLDDLRAIEAEVPGGTETRNVDPSGRLIYIAYRVPPSGR